MQLRSIRLVTLAGTFALALLTSHASAQVQAPTVTVAGVGYLNYSYQLRTDSSIAPVGHSNNFDVARSYIRALGKFAGGVQTQITVDVDGRKAASNQLTFRLKYAFVSWTPENSPLTYKIGAVHTPWLDWEENLNDYRMQGTMPMERAGYLSSSDFGAAIDGMWKYDLIGMQVGVYNGENYNNAPGDSHKDVEGRLSVRLARSNLAGKAGGLRLNAYGQVGKANGGGTRTRYIGMVSYKSRTVTLAAQIGMAQDSVSAALKNQKGQVLAAYGVFRFSDSSKVSLIGRVDQFDPNTDSTATTAATRLAVNKQTRVIAGVSYTLTPNLRVLADVDLNSLKGGSPSNAFDKSRQTLFFHTEFKF
jgi:hypothetical protein